MLSLAFKIADHFLVPKHVLLSQQQAEALLKKYGMAVEQLPRILKTDAAIKELKPEKNSIVKIVRDSPTAGKTVYYRRVA